MHTFKKMTGKPSFYEMRDSQKECQVHNREKCQTEMFLSHVRKNCTRVPWALTSGISDNKVFFFIIINIVTVIVVVIAKKFLLLLKL